MRDSKTTLRSKLKFKSNANDFSTTEVNNIALSSNDDKRNPPFNYLKFQVYGRVTKILEKKENLIISKCLKSLHKKMKMINFNLNTKVSTEVHILN